ncbi:MAG: NAD(P)H-hydrate epimerase [Planctomycetes bacterium]|nr:NAD(P)H-hydrate epimerase [Planctomycetota bacterium]
MDRLPTLTRAQVRQIDCAAIEDYGMPSFALMENAGRALADEVERMLLAAGVARAMAKLGQAGSRDDVPRTVEELERWKAGLGRAPNPVIVLCGPGNNGGDGMVCARTLFNRKHPVECWFVGESGKLAGLSADVRKNADLLLGVGVGLREAYAAAQLAELRAKQANAPLIVDALFGTGLTRALEDPWRDVIQSVNDSGTPVLAVDLPSGLNADTGDVLGVAVRAAVTTTFIAAKPGFYEKAGPLCCGVIKVAEIGIPRPFIEMALKR